MIDDVVAALEAALKTVPGVRYYGDPGARVDPPGVVLQPPSFRWEGYSSDPTTATFQVALVAQADDRALRRLLAHLPAITAAVDTVPDAVVTSATPGTLTAEIGALPAYLIEIEVSLNASP